MKTVKTFQRHCTLLGLVEEKINKKLTKRIEKLSEAHNKKGRAVSQSLQMNTLEFK